MSLVENRAIIGMGAVSRQCLHSPGKYLQYSIKSNDQPELVRVSPTMTQSQHAPQLTDSEPKDTTPSKALHSLSGYSSWAGFTTTVGPHSCEMLLSTRHALSVCSTHVGRAQSSTVEFLYRIRTRSAEAKPDSATMKKSVLLSKVLESSGRLVQISVSADVLAIRNLLIHCRARK